MRILKVHIKNFRSILDETIRFEDLTAFVGPNGAGKSAILRAIDAFYTTHRTLTLDDYYNRDEKLPISIAITFTNLSRAERELLKAYIQNDSLTVTKVVRPDSEKYYGARLQHRPFTEIRRKQSKTEIRSAYTQVRTDPRYTELQSARSADQAIEQMALWEECHPEECEMMPDDGQFFGFRQVGQSRLERFTHYVFVPAVCDAEKDATDTRGSRIFQLMELVVRSVLANQKNLADFRDKFQQEYQSLIDPAKVPQLGDLAGRLTTILADYVPSARVLLDWQTEGSLDVPLPKATVRLEEDGFACLVDRVGHGLQRAFILSLLQNLVSTTASESSDGAVTENEGDTQDRTKEQLIPDLILGIEEPELYQYPSRQRYFFKVLLKLSQGRIPGVARRTQVAYCTHSPLFVDLSCFDSVRRVGKTPNPSDARLPMVSRVSFYTLQSVADELARVQDETPPRPFTSESVKARLKALMTPWLNEGFFADVVVLVEGEEDRAALLGTASTMDVDLERDGIAVIPCGGKNSMDRPFVIFGGLGIPVYLVFDGDQGSNAPPTPNRILQRLLRMKNIDDFPETAVMEKHAVFETSLTKFLKEHIPDQVYSDAVHQFGEECGYFGEAHCRKSALFIEFLLTKAASNGFRANELEQIVSNARALAPSLEHREK